MAQRRPVSERQLVSVLEAEALAGDVKTAQWLLERRWPERWAAPYARGKRDVSVDDKAKSDPFSELDQLAPRREAKTAS